MFFKTIVVNFALSLITAAMDRLKVKIQDPKKSDLIFVTLLAAKKIISILFDDNPNDEKQIWEEMQNMKQAFKQIDDELLFNYKTNEHVQEKKPVLQKEAKNNK